MPTEVLAAPKTDVRDVPEVKILYRGRLFTGRTVAQEDFCTVYVMQPGLDMATAPRFRFSWPTIRDHVNTGNPLKV
jgi:hypothetical protein